MGGRGWTVPSPAPSSHHPALPAAAPLELSCPPRPGGRWGADGTLSSLALKCPDSEKCQITSAGGPCPPLGWPVLPEAVSAGLNETPPGLAEGPGSLLSCLLMSDPTMLLRLRPREFSPGCWVCGSVHGGDNPSELERDFRLCLLCPGSSLGVAASGSRTRLALAQGTQAWGRGQEGAPLGGLSSGRKVSALELRHP